ncbi:RES domain-containing protein [Mycolicibacterium mengxianglii]|uniref:RES domain-containing protein n=1 Tax=Mycolicibacterium mengxianglii TaxID=2736649 RepID=UPI0018EEEA35|nr:RES domain-containing protein [Mycolicibacterium mengxianglii]
MPTGDQIICPDTGFALVPATGQTVFRIAKTSYGAMNPPQRDNSVDRSKWSRWDVPNGSTVYGATDESCSYAEALAALRPAIDIQISDLFDDEENSDLTLEQVVAEEWAERSHMKPGSIPAGWRSERNMHQLILPTYGYFVDIAAAESISALFKNHGDVLAAAGVEHLTTSHVTSEQRALTTSIARIVHRGVLFDGSLPHGIYYMSKHDRAWECWAVWLRAVDDGKDVGSEPTKADAGTVIKKPHLNRPLKRVCDLFSLTCH